MVFKSTKKDMSDSDRDMDDEALVLLAQKFKNFF